MKKIILISGLVLFIANLSFGFILTIYPTFNALLNCGVIAATTLLLYLLRCIHMGDAFYISLSGIFGCLGVVEFVLGLLAPDSIENNWYLLLVILLIAFEAILLATSYVIHTSTKKTN